ncbi:MAG TPA: DUF1543 domain-containing protein [Candidatus Paceibacterota bacterium]
MSKLFAVLLGGRPTGATIEQHNVFFGVGEKLEELFPAIKRFWTAAPKIHIDAYMVIEQVGDYSVVPLKKNELTDPVRGEQRLFFVNLGGYQAGVFDEIHKKLFIVAPDMKAALLAANTDPFFSEGIRAGQAVPHIDDKHPLDEFGDDTPLDLGEQVNPQGYVLCLNKISSGSKAYPEPFITGFLRVA